MIDRILDRRLATIAPPEELKATVGQYADLAWERMGELSERVKGYTVREPARARSCLWPGSVTGMYDQTSLKSKMIPRPVTDGSGLESEEGVAEFIDDLVNLTELQVKLAALDSREILRRVAVPAGLLVACIVMASAATTIFLFGSALVLASRMNISDGRALILMTSAAMIVACPVAVVSAVRLRRGLDGFQASREELKCNVAWLRSVLVTQRQPHVPRNG